MASSPLLKTLVVGAGAGLAAALLFAGLQTQSVGARILFLASPLPIAVAWIGFGQLAGIAAVIAASLSVAIAMSGADPGNSAMFARIGVFLALVAIPCGWLCHLAITPVRPRAPADKPHWREPSELLAWVAGVVALGGLAAHWVTATNDPADLALIVEAMNQAAKAQGRETTITVADLQALTGSLVPYAIGFVFLIVQTVAVWAAGRAAMLSNLLPRPWVPLNTARVPSWVSAGFAFALAAVFILPQPAAGIAYVLLGSLTGALVLGGLAALHGLTIGRPERPILLFVTYLVAFFPLLPILVIGLADSFFDFRARRLARKPTD